VSGCCCGSVPRRASGFQFRKGSLTAKEANGGNEKGRQRHSEPTGLFRNRVPGQLPARPNLVLCSGASMENSWAPLDQFPALLGGDAALCHALGPLTSALSLRGGAREVFFEDVLSPVRPMA
jgi:hypothetical protein